MLDLIIVNTQDEYAQRMLDFIWEYLYFKTKDTELEATVELSISLNTPWILNIKYKNTIPIWILESIFTSWSITGHSDVIINA